MADLELMATQYAWGCSNCHAMYDAMWRPTTIEKTWAPPVTYLWMTDKPTYNYCPNCGQPFRKELGVNGEATCELRV